MNEIRKPDLNAPRFRKTSCNILNAEFIENLKLKFPQYEHLTSDEIKNIIHCFNENVWKTVIEERDGVELPSQIGHMFIGTCPAAKKRYNMDMKTSLEYMQKIKHRNWESDQHIAKIFFTTFANKYRFKNHELWAFDATRDFSRTVSATYPTNWKKYVEVDPRMKISKVFNRDNYYREREESAKDLLQDYNEFDI
jgi:hypothetical protein